MDLPIDTLIAEAGYLGESALRARAVLEEARLTRPGKQRIALAKAERARQVLLERLARRCGPDAARSPDPLGREVVVVPTEGCELCGGSSNRRAGLLAVSAMEGAGIHHLLVLGGTTNTVAALREGLDQPRIEVRWIDGRQGTRSDKVVEADVAWADLVVFWASTPLPHKVSLPYTNEVRRSGTRRITVSRRGAAAVCEEIARACA